MSTYHCTPSLVLFTVLDEKLLTKLVKQYKRQVDKQFNEEEQVKERKAKIKISKEFMLTEAEEKELPMEFDLETYVSRNMTLLKKHGLEAFLSIHGWTMNQLCNYFTQTSSLLRPVTSISFM